eukprot:4493931-Amphidinium_carterae.1
MCSRHALHRLQHSIHGMRGPHVGVEPHTLSFGFANSPRSISRRQCVTGFLHLGRILEAPCLELGACLGLWGGAK